MEGDRGELSFFFLPRLPCVSESRIAFRLLSQTTFGSARASLCESKHFAQLRGFIFYFILWEKWRKETLFFFFTIQTFHLYLLELTVS